MNEYCKKQAIAHAKKEQPNESCGLFLKTEKGFEYFRWKMLLMNLKQILLL